MELCMAQRAGRGEPDVAARRATETRNRLQEIQESDTMNQAVADWPARG